MNQYIKFILLLNLITIVTFGQGKTDEHSFKLIHEIKTTPIKNQYRSNTCWSFAAISMLESELIRMGKPEIDLSEMFVVKYTLIDKAKKYVRLHGNLNFSGGGEFNDVIDIIRRYGIVPESVFNGKNIGEKEHIHGEMSEVLKSYIDAVVKNKNDKLSPVWDEGFELVLNAYLGPTPTNFTYNNINYTPESFAKSLGINPDNYILITSFNHHPYYSKFILELPDNWSWESYYNVELNDLMHIVDNSLKNNYTVAWAGDITEDYFNWDKGIASLPDETKEITVTARQQGFDNYETTDDHGMQITGIAKKNNIDYYYMKNSWGTNNNYNGYIYVSKNYFLYKTIAIMVNKEAIPDDIAKKMGLK